MVLQPQDIVQVMIDNWFCECHPRRLAYYCRSELREMNVDVTTEEACARACVMSCAHDSLIRSVHALYAFIKQVVAHSTEVSFVSSISTLVINICTNLNGFNKYV